MIEFYDTFPAHLFIEMCYGRKNKFGFIYEEKLNSDDFKLLCEAYGVFDGCYELALEIVNKIYSNVQKNIFCFDFDINNIDFIKNIIIKITNTPNSTYLPKLSKIKDDKYYPLVLNVGIRKGKRVIISAVMHELLHAYENYERFMSNSITIDQQAQNIGYYKNPIVKTKEYANYKRKVSYILYHLTDFERNAYIAQIKGLLQSCEDNYENVAQVLQYIKKTTPYINYYTIFSWGEELCNVTDEKLKTEILSYVKELSNNNFTTYNQFVKWLTTKMLKYQKKFNNIIPKIAGEYIGIEESLNNPIDYLIG